MNNVDTKGILFLTFGRESSIVNNVIDDVCL